MSEDVKFNASLVGLGAAVIKSTARGLVKAYDSVVDDYTDHLRATYDRCTKIRTIFSTGRSVDLMNLYVPVEFSFGDKRFDDYSVIENIYQIKRLVILGTGGGGKTIFLKFLWTCLFESPKDRIPLFFEMRNFNDISNPDFFVFMYHSIAGLKQRFTIDAFRAAIKSGKYVMIFDGFDELNDERRSNAEKALIELGRHNPENIVVVSSRYDARFSSWQGFVSYSVCTLRKDQAIAIAEKINFEPTVTKNKFISRLKRDLFEKHSAFLSTPLLVSMMLITFDQFADVPEKICVFYEQVFDALYAKHDATKEAYKRIIFSGLQIDLFKKLLSAFCMRSYYDQEYELTETQMLKYTREAQVLTGVQCDPAAFVRDLKESVCLLQPEGLEYCFSHRTFQEFFSAYYLNEMVYSAEKVKQICRQILAKSDDRVVSMFFDINRSACEIQVIEPLVREVLRKADYRENLSYALRYIRAFGLEVIFIRQDRRLVFIPQGPVTGLMNLLWEKYELGAGKRTYPTRWHPLEITVPDTFPTGNKATRMPQISLLTFESEGNANSNYKSRFPFKTVMVNDVYVDFRPIDKWARSMRRKLNTILSNIAQSKKVSTASFMEMYGPKKV